METSPERRIVIPTRVLAEVLKSKAESDFRDYLMGVYLDSAGMLVATNTHRLAVASCVEGAVPEGGVCVTLPKKLVSEIKKKRGNRQHDLVFDLPPKLPNQVPGVSVTADIYLHWETDEDIPVPLRDFRPSERVATGEVSVGQRKYPDWRRAIAKDVSKYHHVSMDLPGVMLAKWGVAAGADLYIPKDEKGVWVVVYKVDDVGIVTLLVPMRDESPGKAIVADGLESCRAIFNAATGKG